MSRFLFFSVILFSINLNAQTIKLDAGSLEAVQVYMSIEKLMGSKVVKAVKDSTVKEVDEPTFVKVKGIQFSNGTIEVKVLSRLLKNAPVFSRGFIGIAFRINENNTKFESIYIRPTNGRANDQVRRNHSTQYYSYPDYKFDRLRKESPELYESYADMELNKWITMRIEVNGAQAKLFLDHNKQPSLIVNDLKHGANASGAIALWVEVGTEGYFKDLKITKK
ncbi:family 16 glycoside hydrolase [Lacibacter sediminis]|uniref:3-keto-alpha-glucoside-1,2-lyase/3-keto-2-hydroxy-glucal hydratase domain-containing protein n=1 Tax=Lacibacter sediminis TaxID=2760713 RepID=A0A7G5XH21_9BACT|nr:hypothetical protein [Lacibacter sediminis]QNA44774.1 hypothetical protein H4075_00835 [Lacibacter sediminis]